ncbi:histidine phosphatase family protein [Alphaproteobacteria bacterium LSUCC0684]
MRHALAPGYGDPADFKIDDCSTQRNLDQRGREQARQLGRIFREERVSFDQILSSEWCRCKDTADELGLGAWQSFDGLNSFFQGYADREKTLAKLRERLDSLPPGKLVLMVTHQVVISAITGNSVGSGGIVLYNTTSAMSRSMGVITR